MTKPKKKEPLITGQHDRALWQKFGLELPAHYMKPLLNESALFERSLWIELANRCLNEMRDGVTVPGLQACVRHYLQMLDRLVEDSPKTLANPDGPPRKLACKAGCELCCHQRVVGITVLMLNLVDGFKNLPPATQEKIRIRLVEVRDMRRALPAAEAFHSQTPCPMLINGKCSVYAHRPAVCRFYHSFSLPACLTRLRDRDMTPVIPQHHGLQRVFIVLNEAFRESLTAAGVDTRELELSDAVLIGLDNPSPWREFLSSETFFDGAHRPELREISLEFAKTRRTSPNPSS